MVDKIEFRPNKPNTTSLELIDLLKTNFEWFIRI